MAGFGPINIRIFRTGVRQDFDPNARQGIPFHEEVVPGKYDEDWSHGMQLFHNSKARIPIPQEFFEGCSHHFFEGKRRTSFLPAGFIHESITQVMRIVPEGGIITPTR